MLKVISGAQTGADVAGLWAAKHFGIVTGGLAPKGFKTLLGNRPEMAETFGIVEHPDPSYSARTVENVRSSNVTLICSEKLSAGTRLTVKACKENKVEFFYCQLDPENISASIDAAIVRHFPHLVNAIKNAEVLGLDFTLNVAGNSSNNSQRAFEFTYKICRALFRQLGYETVADEYDWKPIKDTWK